MNTSNRAIECRPGRPLPHRARDWCWWAASRPDNFLNMRLLPWDVLPEVAQRQVSRYRQMTPTEKLACADALWDLAWDATRLGVRMRNPEFTDSEVTRAARLAFDNASD